MVMERKDKIEAVNKLSAEIDSRPSQVHVLLDKMSATELCLLLESKNLSIQEINKILQEKGIYTDEEIVRFLSTDQFKTIMESKKGDTFFNFMPALNCRPIEDQPESMQQLNLFK